MNNKYKIIFCKSEMKDKRNINKYYSIDIEWKEEAKAVAKAVNGIITTL